MGMDADCLRKVNVKLRYLTPNAHKVEPLNRKYVIVTKPPEIHILEPHGGYVHDETGNKFPIGFDLICVSPYSRGLGGILFLFQITTYIDWEIGFVSAKGFVRESHRLLVSLPMLHLLPGTHIALNMLTPWKGPGKLGYWPAFVRTAHYAGILYSSFQKLQEVDEIFKKAAQLGTNINSLPQLSWDFQIKGFINSLQVLEDKLNSLLQDFYHQVLRRNGDEQEVVKLQRRPTGDALFPGSRYA